MLGQRIKKYLTENGIKQTYLADKTGFTNSIISDMLNGTRKIETTEYFKICKALDVSFDFFYEDEEWNLTKQTELISN